VLAAIPPPAPQQPSSNSSASSAATAPAGPTVPPAGAPAAGAAGGGGRKGQHAGGAKREAGAPAAAVGRYEFRGVLTAKARPCFSRPCVLFPLNAS
jgi:hypothetical protein